MPSFEGGSYSFFNYKISDEDLIYYESAPKWQQIRRAANCFLEFSMLNNSRGMEKEWENIKLSSLDDKRPLLLLQSHMLPMLVNLAFTLELYLRCILVFEGKDPGRQHNTYMLFNRINEETRRLIIRSITYKSNRCCSFAPHKKEFHERFGLLAKTFVDGRYYYDKLDAPFLKQDFFFIHTIVRVLFRFTNRKMERFYKLHQLQ